ncbi:MAG: site-specific integrase [Syntrophorhabdus aromaticivorans]|uniref:Site-specific integrase n=1 Tax=Syntrophorhabdus aromaticivorans TaxID=328301 RepID=A0A971M247_9BACT|nr:site-specific integrase [Syntrophorhabdus aromaticivorans]
MSLPDQSLSKHLLDHFEHLALTDITPKVISEYKFKRLEEEAAPKTVLNELVLLGHVFTLAAGEWELVNENPVKRVRKPTIDNKIDRWLTCDEGTKLLNASLRWLKEIILFAVNTGLRQGEILGLQWSHVDLFRKTLYISEQKNKEKDTLPLNGAALNVLKQRARVRQLANNYVFVNMDGNRINTRNLLRAFYSSCHKAEIADLRFHDLRHTFATRLVQAGVDLYVVQKLGRWKNIAMLQRYAHHYPESLRPGVEVLDKIITNLSQSNKEGANRDG